MKYPIQKNTVQETLVIPLYGRKMCSEKYPGLFRDENALRLMEQGNLESALRQLLRADTRDDGWYALQGKILMGLHRYDEAHQSYREAIKLDPDNREYRAGALDAVVAGRNSKKLNVKIQNWFKDSFGKR